MTSSIVSSLANRFLATTRCAGRSAFSSFAFGLVCLAIFSPNGGILSPATPPNQRNGPSSKCPDRRISRGCRRRDDQDGLLDEPKNRHLHRLSSWALLRAPTYRAHNRLLAQAQLSRAEGGAWFNIRFR